eukprot:gnl/TRDRNA2_/TRDRNA2_128840_c0_seq1.p1 gnl/TRDRNA2_/TRDRNA2_128840_c0~~gnl/TRDRNA2_/TRDRNA2_128840_c0_seq1.p1  ORF type:complete len:181 (+),score=13.32 gnl/TRDRNA2_/TRDRNA2_128840_c0_seq1:22-564(+)
MCLFLLNINLLSYDVGCHFFAQIKVSRPGEERGGGFTSLHSSVPPRNKKLLRRETPRVRGEERGVATLASFFAPHIAQKAREKANTARLEAELPEVQTCSPHEARSVLHVGRSSVLRNVAPRMRDIKAEKFAECTKEVCPWSNQQKELHHNQYMSRKDIRDNHTRSFRKSCMKCSSLSLF